MKKRGDNIVELSSLGRPVNVDGEIKSTKILKKIGKEYGKGNIQCANYFICRCHHT